MHCFYFYFLLFTSSYTQILSHIPQISSVLIVIVFISFLQKKFNFQKQLKKGRETPHQKNIQCLKPLQHLMKHNKDLHILVDIFFFFSQTSFYFISRKFYFSIFFSFLNNFCRHHLVQVVLFFFEIQFTTIFII